MLKYQICWGYPLVYAFKDVVDKIYSFFLKTKILRVSQVPLQLYMVSPFHFNISMLTLAHSSDFPTIFRHAS